MTEITLTPQEAYVRFKELGKMLLPAAVYKKVIPEATQRKEVELLKETLSYDRFFFVMDLHSMTIRHAHGIHKWLGYHDKDFTLLKFLEIIHPSHFLTHNISATILITGLMRGDWPVEFLKHRYITDICLKHANGKYLIFKRLGCPFQYDKEHHLLEYLNEFTLIGEYKHGMPYAIRALHEDGTRIWQDDMQERLRAAFTSQNLFSFQEIRILRKYAYFPDTSVKELSETFKILDSTVNTHSKRIKKKALKLFHIKFDSVKTLAEYLRVQGLL